METLDGGIPATLNCYILIEYPIEVATGLQLYKARWRSLALQHGGIV
jgi:hypothetical protein